MSGYFYNILTKLAYRIVFRKSATTPSALGVQIAHKLSIFISSYEISSTSWDRQQNPIGVTSCMYFDSGYYIQFLSFLYCALIISH